MQLAQLDTAAYYGTKMRVRQGTIDLIERTFAEDVLAFSGPTG